jgi:hypothetical protein
LQACALFALSRTHFAFTLVTKDSFTLFLKTAMARVKSTTHPHDDATDVGGEGSAERTKSDEGSHTRNYHFGPSMVIVSRIREMIDNVYFTDGMDRMPVEETILEAHADEAIVFKELFTAGLRMPPHLVLLDILLKFQVKLHHLTPNIV